jgi:hypothetical protein
MRFAGSSLPLVGYTVDLFLNKRTVSEMKNTEPVTASKFARNAFGEFARVLCGIGCTSALLF